MFRPTSPQVSLLESFHLLPPSKKERLEKSWAQVFNMRILPLINEEVLRACFDPENGRPNRSIRMLTAVHVLKAWNDLTDEQTLENVEFNLQWHYALGITAEEAHLPQKTMHNFRVKLMQSGQGKAMFNSLVKGLIEMDGLSVSRQRLDSTHIMSDIAVLTRLGLFVETETHFLRELKAEFPEKVACLEEAVVRRYLEREGYFSDAKREQVQRRLPVTALDLLYLVRKFEKDEAVNTWESYLMMVRLLDEQCDITEGEGGESEKEDKIKVALKDPKRIGGDSLQSPYDPDATYGHKGKGYEAQVVETCVKENPYQVVTHIEINGAHESDQPVTVPVIEKLADKGLNPEVLLADTNYGSGENIVASSVEGVALLAPVHDPDAPKKTDSRWETAEVAASTDLVDSASCEDIAASTPTLDSDTVEPAPTADHLEPAPTVGTGTVERADPFEPAPTAGIGTVKRAPTVDPLEPALTVDSGTVEPASTVDKVKAAPNDTTSTPVAKLLGLEAFLFNALFNEVQTCPAGHSPARQEVLEGSVPYKATFSGRTCDNCPFANQCPTKHVVGTKDRVLNWRDVNAATATRQREQQEAAFKQVYKVRGGIEATMAELKGRHGADDLRVRGQPQVDLAMTFKTMTMNVKRAVQYHLERIRAAAQCVPGEMAVAG